MGKIPIATITKPHGVKGALRVKTDSDFKAQRYEKGNTLYAQLNGEYIPLTVKSYFEKDTLDVVSFEEFDNVNDVEKFRNVTLYIDDHTRGALENDAFYFDDLIGLEVFQHDVFVGTVSEVLDMPQSAMLRIKTDEENTKLVPFLKVYIASVDTEKQRIDLNEVEGLL